MDGTLDDMYLTWLYGQVSPLRLKNPARTYWHLFRQLYAREFSWWVPNDDNRAEDGKDLRREFLEVHGITDPDPNWMGLACSMLELLLGLSRRLSFEADGEPRDWFWHLLETVDLRKHCDRDYNDDARRHIDEVMENIIWRRYAPNGQGGLFPLRNPPLDQRNVELWYQLSSYLVELFN